MDGLDAKADKDDGSVNSEKRPWYAINKKYIPLKLMYFFFMGGRACSATYRAIFMRHLGLSTKQAGIIWMVERILMMIIPYSVGGFTDKTRKPKMILLSLIIAGAITVFSMYFIPQEQYVESNLGRPLSLQNISTGEFSFCWRVKWNSSTECFLSDPHTASKTCQSNITTLSTFPPQITLTVPNINFSFPFGTKGQDAAITALPSVKGCLDGVFNTSSSLSTMTVTSEVTQYTLSLNITNNLYYAEDTNTSFLCYEKTNATNVSCETFIQNPIDEYGVTFWVLTVLTIISAFTGSGVQPVLEATVLGVLGEKNRSKFGQQRLWASVGFGIAALVTGYLRDRSVKTPGQLSGNNREFLPIFLGVLICWTCAAVVTSRLPIKNDKPEKKVSLKDIKKIMKNPRAVAFYVSLLIFGMTDSVRQIYLFWFIEIKLNSPSFIFGIATFIGSFVDIPFCFCAGYLIKKFGHNTLFCFGIFAYGVRVYAPVFIVNYWQLLATESIKAIAWGLTTVVIFSYTSKIAPKGLENSAMGLTQGIMQGVAFSIGSLLGGVIFQWKGGDFLFLLFGSLNMVTAVSYAVFIFCTRQSDNKDNAEYNAKEEDAKVHITSHNDENELGTE